MIKRFSFIFILAMFMLSLTGCSGFTKKFGDKIQTKDFRMTVHEARIIRGEFGELPSEYSGFDRMIVDVEILNNRSDILELTLAGSFYLLIDSQVIINPINTIDTDVPKNSLGKHGFYNAIFSLERNMTLQGFMAFDVPKTARSVRFIYEENTAKAEKSDETAQKESKKDSETTQKNNVKIYKATVPYVSPQVHSGGTAAVDGFERRALEAGLVLEIEHDYDGWGTFWMGAHKYSKKAEYLSKRPDPLYTIDLTVDRTYEYSEEEYDEYAGNVMAIGGMESKNEWKNEKYTYKYQVNTSDTQFGLVYRGGTLNFYTVAPIEFRAEIIKLLEYLPIVFDAKT